MVSALITVAVIAWCAQLALGGWQISRFNRAFDTLCQQGRVGVGRSSGRFKPRVVVAIALDDVVVNAMIEGGIKPAEETALIFVMLSRDGFEQCCT